MLHFKSCSVKSWSYATKERLQTIEQDMPGYPPKHSGGLCEQLGLKKDSYQEKAFLRAGEGIYKLPGEGRTSDLNFHKNRVRTSKSRTMTAGYEALFVPPKSWSVGYAYADASTKKKIIECLEGANAKLIQEIEKRAGIVLQRDGLSEFHPTKIAVTTFTHGCNRDGDSNIHFHNYIKRAVWNPLTKELQGSGLNTQRIRQAEKLIGAISRQELIKLAKERGLAVTIEKIVTKTGIDFVPELAGVPKALVDAHSSGKKRIEKALNKLGQSLATTTRRTAILVNQITRDKKQPRTEFETLLKNQELLSKVGLPPDYDIDLRTGIKQGTNSVRESLDIVNERLYTHYKTAEEAIDAAIAHIVEREAVIVSKSLLLETALKQSNYVFSAEKLDAAFEEKIRTGELVYRHPELVRAGQDFYSDGKRIKNPFSITTRMVIEQEQKTVDLYRKSIDTRQAVSSVRKINDAINQMEKTFQENLTPQEIEDGKGKFTQGQLDMVFTVMLSNDSVVAIEGWAGSGKTSAATVISNLANQSTKDLVAAAPTLLTVANLAGFNVVGVAPSNQARIALTNAGIQTCTMQSLVRNGAINSKAWQEITEKTILLADEASMWGTLDFNAIIEETMRRGARIAFIGDRAQLQSTTRGNPFAQLADVAEAIGRKVTLNQEQRSKTDIAKNAHFLARNDQVTAIDFLKEHGAVYEGAEYAQIQHILEEIKGLSLEELYQCPVIVDTNKARRKITQAIRRELGFANEVTLKTLEVHNFTRAELLNYRNYEEKFIITMRNKTSEFTANEKLVVISIEGHLLLVERANGHRIRFDPAKHGFNIQSVGVAEEISTSVGESLRFTANMKSIEGDEIVNGDRVRVDAIDHKRKVIRCSLIDYEGRKNKEYSFSYANRVSVRNGFASTIHSLQGATISRGFYWVSNTSREAFHTAVTRFRGLIHEKKWGAGIKIVCKRVDSKLKAKITDSVRKMEALPKQNVIRKIEQVNAFVVPTKFDDLIERAKNEIRVPKVLENDSNFIAQRMEEFKRRFGTEMIVIGSDTLISKVHSLNKSQNLGLELVDHGKLEAIQDKTIEQKMDILI